MPLARPPVRPSSSMKPGPKTAMAAAITAAAAIAAPVVMTWEGKSNDPYRDIVGVRTVCYGETRGVQQRRYSDAECAMMLHKAIEHDFAPAVLKCTPGLIGHPFQFAAAISLSYNVGSGAYCRSTADRLFDAGDWRGGCAAFARWNRAGGRVIRGLTNRRRDEIALCLKGVA